MKDRYSGIHVTMDTNDLSIRLGFAPDWVKIKSNAAGVGLYWHRSMGNDAGWDRVAAGDVTVNTDKGVKLVQFDDGSGLPSAQTGDPTVISTDEWYKADGIVITSDAAFLADDTVIHVEAGVDDKFFCKLVHDAGDAVHTYAQDSSIDFVAAGVSGGGKCILYNQTNGDYAYIGEVLKPQGKTKYCRLTTYTDAACTSATTAADFDDDDVLYVFRADEMGYPLSDIGLMT